MKWVFIQKKKTESLLYYSHFSLPFNISSSFFEIENLICLFLCVSFLFIPKWRRLSTIFTVQKYLFYATSPSLCILISWIRMCNFNYLIVVCWSWYELKLAKLRHAQESILGTFLSCLMTGLKISQLLREINRIN